MKHGVLAPPAGTVRGNFTTSAYYSSPIATLAYHLEDEMSAAAWTLAQINHSIRDADLAKAEDRGPDEQPNEEVEVATDMEPKGHTIMWDFSIPLTPPEGTKDG